MSNNKNFFVPFGKLIKPFGINGEINSILFNEESKLVLDEKDIWIEGDKSNQYRVKRFAPNGKFSKISFYDIVDRNAAYALCNKIFFIKRKNFYKDSNDEIFLIDLIGLTLFNQFEDKIGFIKEILHVPTCNCLLVNYNNKDVIIPILRENILFFDIDNSILKLDFDQSFLEQ